MRSYVTWAPVCVLSCSSGMLPHSGRGKVTGGGSEGYGGTLGSEPYFTSSTLVFVWNFHGMFFVGGLGSGHKSHILEPPRNVSKLRSMVKVLVRTPFYGWQGRRHSQADNIVSVSHAFCGQNFFLSQFKSNGSLWVRHPQSWFPCNLGAWDLLRNTQTSTVGCQRIQHNKNICFVILHFRKVHYDVLQSQTIDTKTCC